MHTPLPTSSSGHDKDLSFRLFGGRHRLALGLSLIIACASTALAWGSARPPGTVRVGCGNVIDNPQNVQMRHARVVLGSVAVPVGPLQRARRVLTYRRWVYWTKQGVDVRAGVGPPVEISLRQSWTTKGRVIWGNGLPRATAVQFARCGPKSNRWNGYSGGFYISGPSACVPLRIRVGRATAFVTVAIGRRCN
jgi:hypothetical protein